MPSTTLSIDEFREKIAQSRVKCQLCGFRGHALTDHIMSAHKLTPGQYKNQFQAAPLISPIVTEVLRNINRRPYHTDRLEDFIQAFQSAATTEDFITELKANFDPLDPALQSYVPTVDTEFYFEPIMAKSIGFAMVKNRNAYIEGPTGCGKTEGVEQLHARLGRPLLRVNMNGDVTVASFIGTMQADPTKGTYFRYGDLPNAMRAGMTLLIDEIDYMPPMIAAVLNSVLEKKKSLHLADTGETILASPGFNVIATANTGGKGDSAGVYTGTEILNTAFLDRFPLKLLVDYLPMKEEIRMLGNRFPNKDSGHIQKLCQMAIEIRKAFVHGTLPVTISTRKLIEILFMEDELGIQQALRLTLLNWLDDDNRDVVSKIMENCGFKP